MSQALPHDSPSNPALRRPFPRLDSLDLLRGVAILGIFLMNTWTMSLPQEAYTNLAQYAPDWIYLQGFPEGHELFTATDHAVYLVIHLLADMKFITMFSMMFGAGILLQGDRAAAKGLSPARIHYARMAVLLVFGLLHAYFLWYGDILFDYAACGMLLFPLRRLPAAVLITLGLLMISMVTVIGQVTWHQNDLPPFGQRIFNTALQPIYDLDNKLVFVGNDIELHAYRADWTVGLPHPRLASLEAEMTHRAIASFRAQTTGFLTWTFFRCGGAILIGMGLQRLRFFHGAWPLTAYVLIAVLAIPLGWFITYQGVLYNDRNGWDDTVLWGTGVEFNYWGSLVTEMGYISAGVLVAIWAADPANWILQKCLVPIRSVGRTALSNYIMQSLIGTTIFYGHGFGLFGYLSRLQLLGVVVAVWTFQLILSPLWLSYFRQGPLEWLWHKIVYWRGEPPALATA